MKRAVLSGFILVTLVASAGELAILEPNAGAEVRLLSKAQKAYLKLPLAERVKKFADAGERAILRLDANAPTPTLLSWKWTPSEGDLVPRFAVEVRRADGLSVFRADAAEPYAFVDNLEIGTDYLWTVSAVVRGDIVAKVSGRFTTDATPPRLLNVPGVPNFRDLGGRVGCDGRKIRQGMIFRCAGLNDNPEDIDFLTWEECRAEWSQGVLTNRPCWQAGHMAGYFDGKFDKDDWHRVPTASARGRERLTEKGRDIALNQFGIRTDLDLRSAGEIAGMKVSPLGDRVRWIHVPFTAYGGLKSARGKTLVKSCFDVFLDTANYPIAFHCIGGQDRTGTLAFLLEALLGVDDEELNRDWECSGFTNPGVWFRHETLFNQIYEAVNAYPGANTREKTEAYLRDCGLTDDDFARLRKLLLADG